MRANLAISLLASIYCLFFSQIDSALAASTLCSDIFTSSQSLRPSNADFYTFPTLESQLQFQLKLKSKELFNFDTVMRSFMRKNETEVYKSLSKANFEKLNESEAEAFRWYTSLEGSYDSINLYLSNPKRGGIDRKAIAPKAMSMMNVFSRLDPLPKGLLLFRGMSFDDQPVYVKGQEINIRSFSSTSLSPQTAYEFATQKHNDYQDIWIIEIADNSVSGFFAGNTNEAEVILQNDLTFEVVSIKTLKPEFRSYGQDRVIYLKTKKKFSSSL